MWDPKEDKGQKILRYFFFFLIQIVLVVEMCFVVFGLTPRVIHFGPVGDENVNGITYRFTVFNRLDVKVKSLNCV